MLKSRLTTGLTILLAGLFLSSPVASYAGSCGCSKCGHHKHAQTAPCKGKCKNKACAGHCNNGK